MTDVWRTTDTMPSDVRCELCRHDIGKVSGCLVTSPWANDRRTHVHVIAGQLIEAPPPPTCDWCGKPTAAADGDLCASCQADAKRQHDEELAAEVRELEEGPEDPDPDV